MSNYTHPAPEYIGRRVITVEAPGAQYFPMRLSHGTTIIDASDPHNGGLTFKCDDGISYRWQDEGQAWNWTKGNDQ